MKILVRMRYVSFEMTKEGTGEGTREGLGDWDGDGGAADIEATGDEEADGFVIDNDNDSSDIAAVC